MGRGKYGMLLLACFQNFSCGGLLFGWAAISSTLLTASEEKGGAALDGKFLHSIFVVASTVNFMGPLLLGLVLDFLGPRACSSFSLAMVLAGFLLFGSATKESGQGYFTLGMCLVAFGGPGVQNAIIHISNLFPNKKATATSLITGCFQLSFIIFLVFDYVWRASGDAYSYQEIFKSYGLVVGVCLVLTLVFMPDKPYELKAELRKEIAQEPQLAFQYEGKTERDFERSKLRLPSVLMKHPVRPGGPGGRVSAATPLRQSPPQVPGLGSPAEARTSGALAARRRSDLKHKASLTQQLMSGQLLRATLLLAVAAFWANFYIGVVDVQLADQNFLSPTAQVMCVQAFTAIVTGGVLGIPVVGWLMDHVGFPATAISTLGLGLVFAVGVLLQNQAALLVGYVGYALFRTFLFTYFFGYLGDALGFRFFGILSGVCFAITGVVGLLQYPLSGWGVGTCHLDPSPGCDTGNWQLLNYIQLLCLLLLLVVPILDHRLEKPTVSTGPTSPGMVTSPIVSRKTLEGLRILQPEGERLTSGGSGPVGPGGRPYASDYL